MNSLPGRLPSTLNVTEINEINATAYKFCNKSKGPVSLFPNTVDTEKDVCFLAEQEIEDHFQFTRSFSYRQKHRLYGEKKQSDSTSTISPIKQPQNNIVSKKSISYRLETRRKSASFSEFGMLQKICEREKETVKKLSSRSRSTSGNHKVNTIVFKSKTNGLPENISRRSLQERSVYEIFKARTLQYQCNMISEKVLDRSIRRIHSTGTMDGIYEICSVDQAKSAPTSPIFKRSEKFKQLDSKSASNFINHDNLEKDASNKSMMVVRTDNDKFFKRNESWRKPFKNNNNFPLKEAGTKAKTKNVIDEIMKKNFFLHAQQTYYHDEYQKYLQHFDMQINGLLEVRRRYEYQMLKQHKEDYNGNFEKKSNNFLISVNSCKDCEDLRRNSNYVFSDNMFKVNRSNLSVNVDSDILEGETEEDAEIRREALKCGRIRSSTIVEIPTASIQMDLHTLYLENISTKAISKKGKSLEDTKRRLQRGVAIGGNDDENEKKSMLTVLRQIIKNKETSSIDNFKDFLEYFQSNLVEVCNHYLAVYKDSHWSTISKFDDSQLHVEKEMIKKAELSEQERERYEALWELFYAEISYLLDHLLVLQNVFLKPLTHAKEFGFLLIVDPDILFANLEKLIQVTSNFAEKLLNIFKSCGVSVDRSTEIIVDAFKEFDALLTPEYNSYCLNYQNAKNHLKFLKEDELFIEYIKWCEQDEQCQRRKVEDFMVAPLQHLTKYPLLLKAVRKHTPKDAINNQLLTTTIFDIEQSIKSIEKKISALINLQRLQELYECVKWPTLPETDQKANIPDFVKAEISFNNTTLMNPNRLLIQEGYVTSGDNSKLEFYLFLFDDMLLVTKSRKIKRRHTGTEMRTTEIETSKKKLSIRDHAALAVQYVVHRQPIPLDRLRIYDCDEESTGFKNAFCVIHYNRYHQAVAIYTFQLNSNSDKVKWVKNLKKAKDELIIEASSSSNKDISSDEEFML